MCRRLAALAAVAGIAVMAAASLRAAPIYVLRYAFTNSAFELSPGDVRPYTKYIAGLNDNGDLCGTYKLTNGAFSVYLMGKDGVFHDLFPRSVTPAIWGADANGLTPRRADGSLQIVGSVYLSDGSTHAAVWNVTSNDTYSVQILTNLVWGTNMVVPGEEQNFGEANAINSSGLIVGDGNSLNATVGLYWFPPYKNPDEWGFSDETIPLAVNDQGLALVYYDGAGYPPFGTELVSPGVTTELPGDTMNVPGVEGYTMLGSQVVGQAHFDSNSNYDSSAPFVWNSGDAALTPLPEPDSMTVYQGAAASVNASGDIVGCVYNYPANANYPRGLYYVLWKKAGTSYLPAVLSRRVLVDELDLSNSAAANQPPNVQEPEIQINDNGDIALLHRDSTTTSVRVYEPVTNGVVEFTQHSFSAGKSDPSIVATVTLLRAGGYYGTVTAHYTTSDGDAIAGQDYAAQSGTITWDAGESGPRNITLQLPDNFQYQASDKIFHLNLGGISGAEPGVTNANMVIVGDAQETLAFTRLSDTNNGIYDVQAGASNVVVTLSRASSLDGTLVLSDFYTSPYSASAGVDYEPVTNAAPITWNPGQSGSVSFSIPLLDSSNLTNSINFSVYADGTVDGTNYFDAYGEVDILPHGQTPAFKFDTSAPLLVQNDQLHLTSSVEQGVTVVIQSSTNLTDWTTVAEIPCTNGVVQFNPAIERGQPGLFYRAVVQ